MKKVLLIAPLSFILLTAVLYIGYCSLPKNDPISYPNEAGVVSMLVSDLDGKEKQIDVKDYKVLLSGIINSVPTIKKSVNDRPYAENYYTLTVNTENEQYTYFIYRNGSRCYIEKPYEGIYKVHEIIHMILSKQFEAE